MSEDKRVFKRKLLTKLLQDNQSVSITNADKRKPNGTYVGTVTKRSDIDSSYRIVRHANRMIKKAGGGLGYRLEVKARLGKNSPHAELYVRTVRRRDGTKFRNWSAGSRISLEHGERFDLYLHDKYPY